MPFIWQKRCWIKQDRADMWCIAAGYICTFWFSMCDIEFFQHQLTSVKTMNFGSKYKLFSHLTRNLHDNNVTKEVVFFRQFKCVVGDNNNGSSSKEAPINQESELWVQLKDTKWAHGLQVNWLFTQCRCVMSSIRLCFYVCLCICYLMHECNWVK